MQLLTNYQLSEISLGALYFILAYVFLSYMLYHGLHYKDIFVTSILFILFTLITKMATNFM